MLTRARAHSSLSTHAHFRTHAYMHNTHTALRRELAERGAELQRTKMELSILRQSTPAAGAGGPGGAGGAGCVGERGKAVDALSIRSQEGARGVCAEDKAASAGAGSGSVLDLSWGAKLLEFAAAGGDRGGARGQKGWGGADGQENSHPNVGVRARPRGGSMVLNW